MKIYENISLFVVILYLVAIPVIHGSDHNERKPYIVYMGELPAKSRSALADDHHHMLVDAIGDENIARESKIHSYGKSFNGFAARLLPHEAAKLENHDAVVSVFLSKKQRLRTTRSWDFVGLTENSERSPKAESDIIVGVLDSGIWIDGPSFSDEGFGPPPAKWKGKCVTEANFTGCNNKVIGATSFDLYNVSVSIEGAKSVLDLLGHGSHTASTIAGNAVEGTNLYGLAGGTARGGVPSARIAVYKVCWNGWCIDADVLAGFDEAIADGVDLISLSLGGPPFDFFRNANSIGSFHAMKYGILTSAAGGNEGPGLGTVENVAPWMLTVAATSIDRSFVTTFELGNGKKFTGETVNTFSGRKQMQPLTSGARAALSGQRYRYENASSCDPHTLDETKVKGKIVYCTSVYSDPIIKSLGAIGTIQLDDRTDVANVLALPGSTATSDFGRILDRYINTHKNPTALIHKSRTVKITAPFIASFSSRGPQYISRNILKPDIAAPGIDILAAYTKLSSLSGADSVDDRYSSFNVMTGTSMACPHATAAAAYVKSFHPDWSPAAVKSALMTTATPMKVKFNDAELGTGAGQINPIGASNPGLIYDISFDSYISFLCKQGYNSTELGLIDGKKNYSCSSFKPARGADGLNYPTMYKQLETASSDVAAVFHRTVTNVGDGKSVYKAKITTPDGLCVSVFPDTLRFEELNEKKEFRVVVKGGPMPEGTRILSASLEWDDSKHKVRSSIVIFRR